MRSIPRPVRCGDGVDDLVRYFHNTLQAIAWHTTPFEAFVATIIMLPNWPKAMEPAVQES